MLDTVAAAMYLNGQKEVVRHLDTDADDIYLPVAVLGELLFGANNSGRVTDNLQRIVDFTQTTKLLNIDRETANHYSDIRLELKSRGTPIPVNDLWIAALSRQRHLPLVSRDAHFDYVADLSRLDW